MTKTLQEKILGAFWHKSRREFIPCTASDVADRSGLKMGRVTIELVDMNRKSLVAAESVNNLNVYDLTPIGRDVFIGKPIAENVKPKAERVIAPLLQQYNAKRRLSADARRRKIIAMLSEREMTVEQLADELGITQSPPNNLRKVLRELRDEGKAYSRVERNGRAIINHWRSV